MNKKIILASSLVFSVFLLSACNKIPKNSKTETDNTKTNTVQKESNSQQVTEKTQGNDGVFSGTMKDLLGFGRDQKCTYKDAGGNVTTVYISGKKYRADVSNGDDASQGFHSFGDGEYDYTWQGKTGTKMKHIEFDSKNDSMDENSQQEQKKDINNKQKQDFLDRKETFNCSSWKVDQSLLEVPKDVEFTDMSKVMQQTADTLKGVCDSLSGSQKEECLEGMAKMGNFGK